MRKTYSLNNPQDLRRLNEILSNFAVHINETDHTVSLDEEYLELLRKRNAGRPYAILKENGYLAHITKGKVKARMASETAEQIAMSLGISRRTLFRRMKECERDSDELL
ncbi:MAG: hypothetical protein IKG55_00025 [Solobacterium sp.]|nr:hypothetical protein [Solobacterium sp.]